MRRVIWICASLSLVAHALAVTLLPPMEPATRAKPRAAGSYSTWQMRMAPASTRPATQVPSQSPEAPVVAQAVVDAVQHDAVQAAPPLATTVPSEGPTQQSDQKGSDNIDTGANGDLQGLTEYIPRPQLSLPPVPQAPAIITPPSGRYLPERITGILSLYIDETGKVHHIVSSGTPMPPEFEEAAKQTFMAIPFRPGVLEGVPVKSRIRIEVVFDNTPLPEDAGKPKP